LESLGFNEGLLQLDLSGNKVSDKSTEMLELALKNNNTLEVLNLKKNLVGDEGGLAVLRGVMDNQTIRMVDLRNNTMLGSTLQKVTMLFDKRRKVEKATVVQRYEKQIGELEHYLLKKPKIQEELLNVKLNLKEEEDGLAELKKRLEVETEEENKKTHELEMMYLDIMNQRKSKESKIFEIETQISQIERVHIKELAELQSKISKQKVLQRKKEAQVEEKKRKCLDDGEEHERTLLNLRRQIQKCEHDIEKVEKEHLNLEEIQRKESQGSDIGNHLKTKEHLEEVSKNSKKDRLSQRMIKVSDSDKKSIDNMRNNGQIKVKRDGFKKSASKSFKLKNSYKKSSIPKKKKKKFRKKKSKS
jgi:hypothetical protein